jgi:hypothetical protein
MRVFITTTAKNWITEHPSAIPAEAVQAVWETITNRNGVLEASIVQENGDTSDACLIHFNNEHVLSVHVLA